jgi:hypothetical protein
MALPDTYLLKTASIPAYFDSLLRAQAPQRFSIKFLENLGFKSPTDRLLIGLLKELKFLDADGVPTKRYYEYLDRSQSKKVLAAAVREMYADLFAVDTAANTLSTSDASNKLRTLYAGTKPEITIKRIARTFAGLCEIADFAFPASPKADKEEEELPKTPIPPPPLEPPKHSQKALSLNSLQYHINIVLPESRDQAVYDAIFKSIRDHLR